MMKKVTHLFLTNIIVLFIGFLFSVSANAAMPVFDAANLINTAATVTKLQDQFKQMEANIKSLDGYNFDAVTTNIDALIGDIDTLQYFKARHGSINNYLAKFNDMKYYKDKCFSNKGCSPDEWKAIQLLAFEAQKKANDAMLKNVDRQQTELKKDSSQLATLQNSTRSAAGHMQAIQNTNQLASYQSHQMLQIRGLLVAQQNAEATRAHAEANRKSLEAAADEKFLTTSFKPTPSPRNW
ncbi:MAG: conjugal transfer protein TrbJ [Gammaproteobacteria bacterium]